MTSKLTREQTQQIIDAADAVITALAGTNDEVHRDDTDKMVRLWDDLNDRYAPPEIVRELARIALAAVDSEPAGFFRRYDPDFECLITQCDKDVQDSFPLYLRAQSEPIEANIARDAQRYRFLRDKDAFGDDDEPGLASLDELIELDMNEFDAAVDARMAHPSVDFFTLDNAIQKHERRRCKDRNCNKPIFGYSVDGLCEDCYTAISQQPAPVVQPVMFIDGDISTEDADKLAKVIREFNEEDERPLAKMARIIRENPHPTNECDMPKAQPAPVVPPMQHWEELCRQYPDMSIRDAIIRAAWWNHCRAAMLQAGNSPVIPNGYVMVPKEPTKEILDEFDSIIDYGAEDSVDAWHRLLAAAPQEVK